MSKNKKYEELVFFVHFYEGTKRQLLRHIKLVNDIGFDAFAFHLQGTHKDLIKHSPISAGQMKFGTKHAYADQIEKLLNEIPGKKIIFSFSNPSASAIEAMARRHCSDTVALICDSGPTSRFLPSAYHLFGEEYQVKSTVLKMVFAPLMSLGWSPKFHHDLQHDLETFPQGFKILSIRGWKDKLIPPDHIDEVFEPHSNLDWSKLSLPEAEHLTGLRDFRDDYVPAVEKFLKSVGTIKSM
ncbi:MAG TPA: hypothetical protein VN132_12640 [Bdellovibrio sp.]|nr:hypothetical protein [Bdellovibrio sp.]